MKCICGAQFRNNSDFFRHFSSSIHKNWTKFENTYLNCSICYNISKNTRFICCLKCRNKICNTCYYKLYNSHMQVRCPYCRNSRF